MTLQRASGILSALLLLLAAGSASAATIAYWRMEIDDDPTANGLSVPNEVVGGSSLLSSEAALDGVNLPATTVPLTGLQNDFSVAATIQGGANGINASAAWYPALAVTSISVEFYGRTVEATATPFLFSSGGLDGIVMANPNSLDVTYHVDIGGIPTAFTLANVADMSAAWSHYAFVYDETTGIASFYVDGALVGSVDGPDDSPLVILPGTPVQVGVLMDYAQAGQGTVDEVRIDGSALGPLAFLVPEPGTSALLGLGLSGLAAARRAEARRLRRRHQEFVDGV